MGDLHPHITDPHIQSFISTPGIYSVTVWNILLNLCLQPASPHFSLTCIHCLLQRCPAVQYVIGADVARQ